MRCPICGAKMEQNKICKYCKVTDIQIENCSNKKVKEYRKNDMADLIYFTTYVPKDVSRLKLILYTIFLGILGVNHLYVKRNIRGMYALLSTCIAFSLYILNLCISNVMNIIAFKLFFEIAFMCLAINTILWFGDIINVFLKTFKIPVVLADKE